MKTNLNECSIEELIHRRKIEKIGVAFGMIFGISGMILSLYLYYITGLGVLPVMFFILSAGLFFSLERNYLIDIMIYIKIINQEEKPSDIEIPTLKVIEKKHGLMLTDADKKAEELYKKVTKNMGD